MSILLFVNLKGGVSKTTNAVAVAECLADQGYRTLLIDAVTSACRVNCCWVRSGSSGARTGR